MLQNGKDVCVCVYVCSVCVCVCMLFEHVYMCACTYACEHTCIHIRADLSHCTCTSVQE